MQRIVAFLRFWLLSGGFLILPLGFMGFLLGGLIGAGVGTGLGTVVALGIAFKLEALLGRLHGAVGTTPEGLAHSLARTLQEVGWASPEPKIRIFVDPSPNALVARAWFGSGTIFLSQGLVSLLNEPEIRAVLRQSLRRLSSPGWVTRSFGAALAASLLSKAPRGWVQAALGGKPTAPTLPPVLRPGGMLGFVTLYALSRSAVRLAGAACFEADVDRDWQDAAFKIRKELAVWPLGGNPGAVSLYLENPWPGTSLMSLS